MTDTITPKVAIAISASLNVDEVSVLARSTEAVPDAANGMDQRIGLLVVDLAAHPPDIDVDDIRRRIEVEVPDVLEQHGARDHASFVAHQIFQKLELLRQEIDLLAVPAHRPRYQVDGEVADTQDGLLGNSLAAPAECLQARQQFDERERLDQIVVAAGAQAPHALGDLSERTDDEEGSGDAGVAQLPH